MENEVTHFQEYKSLKDNKELREQARAMYMLDKFYPTEIAQRLSVDINELGRYVFGDNGKGTSPHCWKYKKENDGEQFYVKTYEKVKSLYIKKTQKEILDLASMVIESIKNDPDKINEMKASDLKNLIDSYEKVDKIGRLEDGEATSNVAVGRTTFSLRDILKSEPDDADVIEIRDAD